MELNSESRPAERSNPALKIVDAEIGRIDAGAHRRHPPEEAPASAAMLEGLSDEARSAAILSLILQELEDDKAEEVVKIDLSGKTDIADAMVVASGRSARHVGAMADKVLRRLKDAGFGRARMEGAPACDWVLIDADYVIVHLFRPEVRKFYNLERIWSENARAPLRPDA